MPTTALDSVGTCSACGSGTSAFPLDRYSTLNSSQEFHTPESEGAPPQPRLRNSFRASNVSRPSNTASHKMSLPDLAEEEGSSQSIDVMINGQEEQPKVLTTKPFQGNDFDIDQSEKSLDVRSITVGQSPIKPVIEHTMQHIREWEEAGFQSEEQYNLIMAIIASDVSPEQRKLLASKLELKE